MQQGSSEAVEGVKAMQRDAKGLWEAAAHQNGQEWSRVVVAIVGSSCSKIAGGVVLALNQKSSARP